MSSYYGASEADRRASKDFVQIVDVAACSRLKADVELSVAKGAKLEFRRHLRHLRTLCGADHPHGVTADMAIMGEEIFGPILPILAYDSIEQAFDYIHAHPKPPLALYVFGRSRQAAEEVIARTTSGSACINDLIIQTENANVPFGGIGMSGTGSYHGFYGFKTFSHERNVMRQGPVNLTSGFYPPYGSASQGRMKGMLERVLGMR